MQPLLLSERVTNMKTISTHESNLKFQPTEQTDLETCEMLNSSHAETASFKGIIHSEFKFMFQTGVTFFREIKMKDKKRLRMI